jgi:hypothetical protein
MRDRVMRALAAIDGVEVSPSMFGTDDAVWCNGKEIAHFDADDVIDIRLTKAVIRERRAELRADQRVSLRKNASDWLEVKFVSDADVAFVAELGERAAAAHRPSPGVAPKSAPRGAELERRRRFH